ncbi:uncharacterized protein [Diabrotica undecimpunctata]|uniref:uncharacterized protein n=2 Tax=Diabrotica undecimpunctata TaxID=50387 RepID=UPI003B63F0BD
MASMVNGIGYVKLPQDFDLQGQSAASEWKFWKISFEDYLVATGQHDAVDQVKLSILRNIIGHESARIMATFVIPDEELNKYEFTMQLLDKYVNPRVNECFERYNFIKRVQEDGETFEHFLTECRHLVRSCNYNALDPDESCEDKALRDKIVMGIRDPTTREALLRIDKLSLNKAIEFCRTSEQSRSQNLQFQYNTGNINHTQKIEKKKYDIKKKPWNEEKEVEEEVFLCRRCAKKHGPRECPAYGKKCNKCGLKNHYAVACKVKNIKSTEKDDCESTSSNEFFVRNVNSRKKVCNVDLIDTWEEYIEVENYKLKAKLDTGADVNVIPLNVYKKFNCQFKTRPTEYVLKAFDGNVSHSIGVVNLNVKWSGKFPGTYEITTNDKFEPVCYPPTKCPIKIRNSLKTELDRLVQRKAIVKVENIDPRASINRMVIVEKSNGKLRICLDPSDLNKHIVRKPRVGESIEEICSKLLNKNVYSVFDLSESYHQLSIDENSSWKCCFSTHYGTYRFLVLPFGLSNSQDLFQEAVEKHFGDIKNIVVCHDDMIIAGASQDEHDQAVKELINRAKEVGARFNKEKIKFSKKEVKFMGQIFSHLGMKVDPERTDALCKLETPKIKLELQRIIGSVNYIRRYVKNMAEHMQILCELLKNNVEWQWLPKHQECFDKLKKIISNSPALVPFDPNKNSFAM